MPPALFVTVMNVGGGIFVRYVYWWINLDGSMMKMDITHGNIGSLFTTANETASVTITG